MEQAQVTALEHGLAIFGALIVGTAALIALINDWGASGLDNNVTKLMLGLMVLGCVFVAFTSFGALGTPS